MWGILAGAVFLIIFALGYYALYVPGESRELLGTVLSFETHADGESPRVRSLIHVRLDDGAHASATIGSHVVAKIGSRVRILAIKMPILGIERHRFIAFEEQSDVGEKLLQR
jgi:hypothetical protein